MANLQQNAAGRAGQLDPLAAVVLHTLVNEGRGGLALAAVAIACQRDPGTRKGLREVADALDLLIADGLALQRGELYGPTHAAIRASELSF